MSAELVIDLLDGKIDRTGFDCGVEALNRYFAERATQDMRRRFANCFVARTPSGGVAGYYTLSAASFELADLPEAMARKLPRYSSVPALMIGRLAVDLSAAGRGVGRMLLADAAVRAAGTDAAVYALRVDAKDEVAARFYARFGFAGFSNAPLRMYVPLRTIEDALAALP